MSLNLYGLIIKAANENNMNMTLEEISRINDSINELIARGINKDMILNNLEMLM
ncbi:hypothetical protein [Clostridium uliginosum]|uniref:Uncharacterized protein n=1 Tax=Clostridium uliginosum TaxID=119641 RepID=A0A1I1GQS7_9CLOT|nr:hypothetical protein [Clostridium uliginosum]SFC14139.1 hypothetical protein SAMN05421842_10134 [Clostridium uliginosum]